MENDAGGTGSLAESTTTTIAVDPSTTVPTTAALTTAALTTAVAPTTGAAGSADGSIEDPAGTDPGVDRSTDGCDGGTYANHGDYVSSMAHGADRQPGDVPAAAQSDCGKPIPSVDGTDDTTPETPEGSTPDTADEGTPANPGQGHGQGEGLGKGQG
jgi:hypothetical protein